MGSIDSLRLLRACGAEKMTRMATAVRSKDSETEDGKFLKYGPDIQTLGATASDELLTTNEVVLALSY